MQSLLAQKRHISISGDPFPHVVIKDALPEDVYAHLVADYPSIDVIAKSPKWGSNTRYSLTAKEALQNLELTQVWRSFIDAHVSQLFLNEVTGLFADHIRALYPDFESEFGPINGLRSGLRHRETFQEADVLLDAQISVNTPVSRKATSVRRFHVDHPNKLFVGLFYMRHPEDKSGGGDLEIGRFREKPSGFRATELNDRYVEVTKTIHYDSNVLVMFLNGLNSLHGVTERTVTPHPRLLFNLVGEVRAPLFDLAPYQVPADHIDAISGAFGGVMAAASKAVSSLMGRR
jgi:hypothetical protein